MAARIEHRSLAIGFRCLDHTCRVAACLGYDAIGVSLRFVLQALGICARCLHVAERIDDLLRRVDLLQLHLRNADARLVFVERLLDQLMHAVFDRRARTGQDRLDLVAADHFAHRALGHGLDRPLRLLDVEQEIGRVPDHPEYRELHVHDVLVAREHEALRRDVACRGAATRIVEQTNADVGTIDSRHLRRERRLDRVRPVIVEARLGQIDELAEAQHDALLVRVHAVEPRQQPHDDQRKHDEHAAAAAKAARQERAQPILATADQVLKIGRSRSARLRSRAPRALAGRRLRHPTAHHSGSSKAYKPPAHGACVSGWVIGERDPPFNEMRVSRAA